MQVAEQNINDKIDQLELAMMDAEPIHCPLEHTFVEGMYVRKILMPKGSLITSQVHATTHPFFILKGKVAIMSENDGEQIIEAPYMGITLPNTRRVLRIIQDCEWVTVQHTDILPKENTPESILEAVGQVERELMMPYVNQLIGGGLQNNVLLKEID